MKYVDAWKESCGCHGFSRHRFIKENINIDCLGKSLTHEAITRTAVLGRDY